jgi:type IV secretory pathway TrbD component
LAIGTVVGVIVAAGAVLLLHVLPTGYRPLSDAVSLYGVGRFRRLYQLQVVASGLAALALAAGLVAAAVPFGVAIGLLALYGVARVTIARYPADPAPPLTRTGRRHVALAGLAFVSIGLAAPILSGEIADRWQLNPSWFTALSWAVIGTMLAMFAVNSSPRSRPVFGTFERLFYTATFGWLLAMAAEVAGH